LIVFINIYKNQIRLQGQSQSQSQRLSRPRRDLLSFIRKESRPRKRTLAEGWALRLYVWWWFRGGRIGFDETADATGLLACCVTDGVRFVVALHDDGGPGPSGCCRDQSGCTRHRDGTGFVVGAVAPTQESPPTPALRSTTPTTKTRGCYVVAAKTGNGRWPNQQCIRHHRSDPATNTTSQIVASRTGNGRMPAEPQTPRRNHQPWKSQRFCPCRPGSPLSWLTFFSDKRK